MTDPVRIWDKLEHQVYDQLDVRNSFPFLDQLWDLIYYQIKDQLK